MELERAIEGAFAFEELRRALGDRQRPLLVAGPERPERVTRALHEDVRGFAEGRERHFGLRVERGALFASECVVDRVAREHVTEREVARPELFDQTRAKRREQRVDDARRQRLSHPRYRRRRKLAPEDRAARERVTRRLRKQRHAIEDDLSHGRRQRIAARRRGRPAARNARAHSTTNSGLPPVCAAS